MSANNFEIIAKFLRDAAKTVKKPESNKTGIDFKIFEKVIHLTLSETIDNHVTDDEFQELVIINLILKLSENGIETKEIREIIADLSESSERVEGINFEFFIVTDDILPEKEFISSGKPNEEGAISNINYPSDYFDSILEKSETISQEAVESEISIEVGDSVIEIDFSTDQEPLTNDEEEVLEDNFVSMEEETIRESLKEGSDLLGGKN